MTRLQVHLAKQSPSKESCCGDCQWCRVPVGGAISARPRLGRPAAAPIVPPARRARARPARQPRPRTQGVPGSVLRGGCERQLESSTSPRCQNYVSTVVVRSSPLTPDLLYPQDLECTLRFRTLGARLSMLRTLWHATSHPSQCRRKLRRKRANNRRHAPSPT